MLEFGEITGFGKRAAPNWRRQDARRGLCYRTHDGETGGISEPRIHLSQAAKLSRKTDPPLASAEQCYRSRIGVRWSESRVLADLPRHHSNESDTPLGARAVRTL